MSSAPLFERVKAILTKPKPSWAAIDTEEATVSTLYFGYIIPLAAAAALAQLIGWRLSGFQLVRVLPFMAVGFGMQLAGVYLLALVIDALAPTFGGKGSLIQALKVAAYSGTPYWIAGLSAVLALPAVRGIYGLISIVGIIYALYLLYLGLPILMKEPADKASVYSIVAVVAALVLGLVLNQLVIPLFGGGVYSAWSFS